MLACSAWAFIGALIHGWNMTYVKILCTTHWVPLTLGRLPPVDGSFHSSLTPRILRIGIFPHEKDPSFLDYQLHVALSVNA